MAEVRIEGLSKHFDQTRVIDHLDLTVAEGEFVTLLGPSGCGKTTTLRCIAGLEVPSGGDISIGGRLASSPRRGVFVRPEKRDIGMVFQSYALWPHMTVAANVAYPLKLQRVGQAERTRRVEAILELVGLRAFADRQATSLSGGQQQRVAVARALVSSPQLLLFDEPLSNLDSRLRATMRAELRALHARTGTTSICVTHDQTEALTLSDRVVVMNEGRVQQEGTPEEIFGRPANRFVAHFVGFDNFLPGTLVERDREWAHVRVQSTDRVVRCRPGGDGRAGAAVELGLRSSSLSLMSPDDGRDANVLPAVVVDRAYQGESVQYTLAVDRHRLLVQVPVGAQESAGWSEGSAVHVALPEATCFAFPVPAHGPAGAVAPAAVGATGLPIPPDDVPVAGP